LQAQNADLAAASRNSLEPGRAVRPALGLFVERHTVRKLADDAPRAPLPDLPCLLGSADDVGGGAHHLTVVLRLPQVPYRILSIDLHRAALDGTDTTGGSSRRSHDQECEDCNP